jgi:cell division protease FtsH
LKSYKDAVEGIVKLLYKKENITGDEVRKVIIDFEKENGLETKVIDIIDEIEEELKQDAKMSQNEEENKLDTEDEK